MPSISKSWQIFKFLDVILEYLASHAQRHFLLFENLGKLMRDNTRERVAASGDVMAILQFFSFAYKF